MLPARSARTGSCVPVWRLVEAASTVVPVLFEAKQIVVVGRAAERIAPVEIDGRPGRPRVTMLKGCAPKLCSSRRWAGPERPTDRAAADEVAFPDAGRAVVEIARIAGRGEIQRAVGGHVLHRLGDDAAVGGRDDGRLAVLKRRLDGDNRHRRR